PGDYRVRVAASNFAVGAPLAPYWSSPGVSGAFDAASNNLDKGQDAPDPATTGVTSGVVTLGNGVLGDVDPGATGAGDHGPFGDDFDNLTVDFGFVHAYDLTLTKTLETPG